MILRFFSNGSKSIFAKILFTAIILSFCLFGIGDIIRHVSETKTAISVGKHKISAEQLYREYSQIGRMLISIKSASAVLRILVHLFVMWVPPCMFFSLFL